ncbi:hypothetical protein HPB50_023735 [Hyalomma asiaticum]|uniref:Uncharacterized protein n=1 Tax=Hyalomma asiaticum TaxID=266040 RepID=A0ACB7SPH0_HYAAI|nr:hypothetical protein HPB50_023735 [Hyalomma asiaticum]
MKTSANRQHVGKAGKARGTSRVSSTPDVNAAQATAPSSSRAKSGTTDGSGPAFQPHGSPKIEAKYILLPCLAIATFISVVCLLKLLGGPEARRQGPCTDTEEQLSVQTSLGVIKSTAAATSNGQYARVFLGIPFGEGTSGARRFDLATKVTELRSPFAAVKQGPACLQPELQVPLLRAVTVMSDNCLTLNIWTPSRCSMGESESLPVIFFLGGWMFHAASWNGLLDWASMAAHGHVIVVSPNFRLGAPGFLHRNGTGPDNVGVQDILLAWHWTKEHIASFGGNASNVVPLGHASGGFVISALLAKPELSAIPGESFPYHDELRRDVRENRVRLNAW